METALTTQPLMGVLWIQLRLTRQNGEIQTHLLKLSFSHAARRQQMLQGGDVANRINTVRFDCDAACGVINNG